MLKRKLLSVLLALSLVVSMAIPALADSIVFPGSNFNIKIVRYPTSASATITCDTTADVEIYGTPIVYLSETGENALGNMTCAREIKTATTYMTNYGYSEIRGIMMQDDIIMVVYTGAIDGIVVKSGRY